jgi:CO/xanthine dehydrogenase Mo-binding subunit
VIVDPSIPSIPSLEPERYELTEARRYTFALQRRDFIRLFGGGLVILVAVPDIFAQESGRVRPQGRSSAGSGQAATPDLAAWLHIDESGLVHVSTGKVEIGQNIRTSLSQTVADELRVPIASISMLMGDTDKTPYDQGTFGSQTTPRMAPQLARAAATAREMLLDQAAARWQADRATLIARDGRIVDPGGRSISYAELTKGQALTGTITASAPTDPREKWQVRGTSLRKVDGRAFVTGAHQYASDVARPGLVYGRIIRPDGFGAALVNVDAARARAMPGATVVRDGDFLGVIAPTERAAVRAAAAVQATWNVPAGQPSSETIYDYLKQNPERGAEPPAISALHMPPGVERTFQASYRIPYIAHTPLEPRTALAEWQDGKLTVWTGTQRPFGVRTELAEAFRIPEDRVRVIVPDMGSGYGGKHTGEVAIEAARLAKAANRPVKIVWTRAEEFSWAYFRPAGVIDIKSGVDASGRILAWAFDNWNSGGSGLQTPYDVASKMQVFHAAKSPLRQGSYRALAATANHYAREMHMDEMARSLGIDAVEFRMLHLKDDRLRAALTAVAQKIGWPKPSAAGRALGIACGTEKAGYVATAVEASRSDRDALPKLERIVIAFDCGAIVNPDGLTNQVQGSVVQALGGALFEAIDFGNGRIRNGTLEQYRVPRFRDVPPIETILLDRRDIPSAGAGESSLIAVAPAIGSAFRAFGKVDAALPIRFLA